ncbi:hypothetical protein C2R22_07340 [Salinigranum rubrum]|uniref:Uncharacterized protein n=1 Tax=Salinigranum rubrum TaxID=755307 RepID=A0A2I8VK93_9EURY|nr:hypothetical protein C2R22_07340 [Salinigranum rubrum]
MVGTAITAGCTSSAENGSEQRSVQTSDPLERGGFELADVQPQQLESYVGITAVVYNGNSESGTVTVRFIAYDASGNRLHEGTDSVTVDAKTQAPISMYWEKEDGNPPFQGWDAMVDSTG